MTMVYYYCYHSSGHYPSSCVVYKGQRFGDTFLSGDRTSFVGWAQTL
jgi:hypothetical protein